MLGLVLMDLLWLLALFMVPTAAFIIHQTQAQVGRFFQIVIFYPLGVALLFLA